MTPASDRTPDGSVDRLAPLRRSLRDLHDDNCRLLGTVVEAADDAVFSTREDETVTSWNPAAERLYGYSADEMIGSTVDRLIPLENRARVAEDSRRLAAGERVAPFETVDIARDGRRIAVSLTLSPIVDASGAFIGTVAIARDISARKAKEDELRFQAQLLDEVKSYVVATDANGHITHWNRFAAEALGWSRDEVLGRHIMGVIPYSKDRVSAVVEALASGDRWVSETAIPRRDGTVFQALSSISPLYDRDGALNGMVETGMDISDRKHAEASRALLAAIVESAEDTIISCTTTGIVTSWNRGAERTFGWSAAEMIGRDTMVLMPPAARAELAAVLARVAGGDSVDHFEAQAVTRDGGSIDVMISSAPITSADGSVTGISTIAHDVTAAKAAERDRARLAAALEQAAESVVITEPDGIISYVNGAFERTSGYVAAQVLGQSIGLLTGLPESDPARVTEVERFVSGTAWSGPMKGLREDRTVYEVESVVWPVRDGHGRLTNIVSIARDVTEERRLTAALDREKALRASISASLGRLRPLETPEQTAAAICAEVMAVPGVDIAAVVQFSSSDSASVLAVAPPDAPVASGTVVPHERRRMLEERAAGGPWCATWRTEPAAGAWGEGFTSFGLRVAAYIPLISDGVVLGLVIAGSHDAARIIDFAEELPILVEYGSVASAFLAPALLAARQEKRLHNDVLRAIREHAFQPVFQPIVELDTGILVGYEALTRFDDGTPPDRRFAEASRIGLGVELEEACLLAAIRESAVLPRHAWLALNVSPDFLLSGRGMGMFLSLARHVVVEITEHAQVDDYAALREAIHALGSGVSLAVDDAGAGYASMKHIVELRPSIVKLDRELVRNLQSDPVQQAMVAGMRYYATRAGCQLLAEGIETEAERDTLRGLTVLLGQGFLFARPMPAAEAAAAAAAVAGEQGDPDDADELGAPLVPGLSRADRKLAVSPLVVAVPAAPPVRVARARRRPTGGKRPS